MTVNVLMCEGSSGSPDARLLNLLVPSGCLVKPSGGKYGLGNNIKIRREVLPQQVIAGIIDRDFDADASLPLNQPRKWIGKEPDGSEIQFGWRWERKEIENYLVDPVVVRNVLNEKYPSDYSEALAHAATSLRKYTAARTALSVSRLRFQQLHNSWGRPQGKDNHKFPEKLGEEACYQELRRIVESHNVERSISVESVLERFEKYLTDLESAQSNRRQHFLVFMAGKDLLFALKPELEAWGLGPPFGFRERVLTGLEHSTEDIHSWLPEWESLRRAIEVFGE